MTASTTHSAPCSAVPPVAPDAPGESGEPVRTGLDTAFIEVPALQAFDGIICVPNTPLSAPRRSGGGQTRV